jgi:fructokinase
MKHQSLFGQVRRNVQVYLNGYVDRDELREGIEAYIVPPSLGDRSGCLGAIAMAKDCRF